MNAREAKREENRAARASLADKPKDASVVKTAAERRAEYNKRPLPPGQVKLAAKLADTICQILTNPETPLMGEMAGALTSKGFGAACKTAARELKLTTVEKDKERIQFFARTHKTYKLSESCAMGDVIAINTTKLGFVTGRFVDFNERRGTCRILVQAKGSSKSSVLRGVFVNKVR